MEGFIIYFLKVIALQSILFGCYWLINRKSNSFQFNRYFLLAALVLPWFIPLLNLPVNLFQREITNEGVFDPWIFIEQSLPMVTINGNSESTGGFSSWISLIVLVYLLVAIPSLFKLLYDYYKIRRLEQTSAKEEFTPKGFRLLYVPCRILSFSFLNKIFLSDLFPLKNHEKRTIITHEEYHLTQKHSLDIILSELVRILCWFNPIVLFIQRNLKETHEYLADRHTLLHHRQQDYTALLRSFKWQEINMTLGSPYSSASIKKRLAMMSQSKSKSTTMKMLSLLLISLFAAFIFACEDDLNSFEAGRNMPTHEISEAELEATMEKTVNQLQMQDAPEEMIELYINEQRNNPDYAYRAYVMYLEALDDAESSIEDLKARFENRMLKSKVIYMKRVPPAGDNATIKARFVSDEFQRNITRHRYAIIEKINRQDLATYNYKMQGEPGIQSNPDINASFEGGMQAFAEFLRENLEYPEIAEANGVEDQLVMQFVITKRGGILYLNVAKEPETKDEEVSIEFQKAAFKAIRSTEGLWEPAEKDGKYVMSKMTLPIEFKLDKTKSTLNK